MRNRSEQEENSIAPDQRHAVINMIFFISLFIMIFYQYGFCMKPSILSISVCMIGNM